MQLNLIERHFILSPIRAFLQNHLETRQLLEMAELYLWVVATKD